MAELHDQLSEIGLPRVDALALQRRVELDFLGRHRLDLDDLPHAVAARDVDHDRVGLVRVTGPVHDAAGRDDVGLQLLQQLRQPGQDVVLDGRSGVA